MPNIAIGTAMIHLRPIWSTKLHITTAPTIKMLLVFMRSSYNSFLLQNEILVKTLFQIKGTN